MWLSIFVLIALSASYNIGSNYRESSAAFLYPLLPNAICMMLYYLGVTVNSIQPDIQ